MKTLILIVLAVVTTNFANAQGFEGRLKYTAVIDFSLDDAKLRDGSLSPEKKNAIAENRLLEKEQQEGSSVLFFNKYESTYLKEDKLGLKDTHTERSPPYYKNLKSGRYIWAKDVMGTIYYESDKLPVFDWKLENEQKMIGEYTCYKATYNHVYESSGIVQNPNGGFEKRITTDTASVTAWYCPQIPVMNGPERFWGLPGLILELTRPSFYSKNPVTLYCTEIALNPKEGIKIKRPEPKKVFTEKELYIEVRRLRGNQY